MQFELPERKKKRGLNLRGSWNVWFAWHPVIAISHRHSPTKKVLVWFEEIERKVIHHSYDRYSGGRTTYEYRTIPKAV